MKFYKLFTSENSDTSSKLIGIVNFPSSWRFLIVWVCFYKQTFWQNNRFRGMRNLLKDKKTQKQQYPYTQTCWAILSYSKEDKNTDLNKTIAYIIKRTVMVQLLQGHFMSFLQPLRIHKLRLSNFFNFKKIGLNQKTCGHQGSKNNFGIINLEQSKNYNQHQTNQKCNEIGESSNGKKKAKICSNYGHKYTLTYLTIIANSSPFYKPIQSSYSLIGDLNE